jgi:hypothetical protein
LSPRRMDNDSVAAGRAAETLRSDSSTDTLRLRRL